jgi:putative transposase
MSRPLRIEWPGALYHVTARGDRREPIVEDDLDRESWVTLLGQTCDRFSWRMHAWCLMGNHYHLLLETPEANLSQGMRHLNGVWSQRFNRRHGRVGHVFQGRFKAIFVEQQSYLLELARYIVLNPVRAGIVALPEQWSWSSYNGTIAAPASNATQAGLQSAWLLSQFSPRRSQAVARYIDFVRAGIGLPSVWDELKSQTFLGSDAFIAQVQARMADDNLLREVPRLQRRPPKVPLAQWAKPQWSVDEAMARAFTSGHYRLREVADHFGVSPATVSRAARAWRVAAAPAEALP